MLYTLYVLCDLCDLCPPPVMDLKLVYTVKGKEEKDRSFIDGSTTI